MTRGTAEPDVKLVSGDARPVVLITGAAGNLGRTLAGALAADYRIAGLDLASTEADYPIFAADLSNLAAVELALSRVRGQFGARIASVVHLVAYFDQEAEEAIKADHGHVPYVILRLAGVYDEKSLVPTLAQQIARIHGRELQGYLYAGSTLTGQSLLHKEDMVDAFRRTIDRRAELPSGTAILVGEPDPMGYDALQDEITYGSRSSRAAPPIRKTAPRRSSPATLPRRGRSPMEAWAPSPTSSRC